MKKTGCHQFVNDPRARYPFGFAYLVGQPIPGCPFGFPFRGHWLSFNRARKMTRQFMQQLYAWAPTWVAGLLFRSNLLHVPWKSHSVCERFQGRFHRRPFRGPGKMIKPPGKPGPSIFRPKQPKRTPMGASVTPNTSQETYSPLAYSALSSEWTSKFSGKQGATVFSEHLQGSLHCTPEHCLVNGGVPLFWWKKPCFKWTTCIF